jgi:D-aspartate ligase
LNTATPVVVLAPGHHGHGIVRSLGRLGVAVYGVHADGNSPAARSRYERRSFVLDFDSKNHVQAATVLLSLAKQIGSRPVLVPTDDVSCLLVDALAATLREAYLFPNQPPGLAQSLSSKESMYRLCRQHGVPTAETVFPKSRDEVAAFAGEAEFPVMLKGIDTTGLKKEKGVGMALARNAAQLLELYDQLETPDSPRLMLQEYVPGDAQSVWMFNGYFDSESRCLFGMTGRKVRQYPAYTGMTSLGVCVANETVAGHTTRFMRALGYQGILDIGYKYDSRTGEYKLLDANPRIGASFRLFVDRGGTDVVRAMYRDLTGQPVSASAPREGRRWLVENFDVISSLRYWKDRELSLGGWIRSFRGVQETSWFALDDPAPFFSMCRASLKWGPGRGQL